MVSLAEYRAMKQAEAAAPKKKGFFLDQLSTGGGIGGALGGAALGTAILPGIGTLIGGALGGALGSGAGELGENVITGEKDIWKNVGSEALMGGVTGVPIFGAAKGLAGAGKALVSGAGKTAANQALATALKVGTGAATKGVAGIASSVGKSAVTDLLGIKTGAKLAGKGILKPQYIDDLSNFVMKQTQGKALPNAADILIKTQNYADDIGKTISKKIAGSKLAVSGANISGDVVKNLQKGLLATDDQLVTGVLDRLKTAKSPTDIWELRKIIDDKISWIANPDAATSNMNAIAHNIRDTLSKTLDKVGVKDLNKEYALAQDAIKLIQKPALSPQGIKLAGMNLGGGIAQRGQIAAGRALGATGSALGNVTAKIPQNLIGTTVRQAGGRTLTGMDQGVQEFDPSMYMTSTPQTMQSVPQESPFGVSSNQLAQALMQAYANGDTASAKQLQGMLELSQSYETGTKTLSEAQQARQDVQSLTQDAINRLSSGQVKAGLISGPVENLKAKVGLADQPTLEFNTLISNLKATIAKARAGTSFTEGEKKLLEQYTPNVGDSEQLLATKLQLLQELFGSQTNVSSLEDALIGNLNQ